MLANAEISLAEARRGADGYGEPQYEPVAERLACNFTGRRRRVRGPGGEDLTASGVALVDYPEGDLLGVGARLTIGGRRYQVVEDVPRPHPTLGHVELWVVECR